MYLQTVNSKRYRQLFLMGVSGADDKSNSLKSFGCIPGLAVSALEMVFRSTKTSRGQLYSGPIVEVNIFFN